MLHDEEEEGGKTIYCDEEECITMIFITLN